MPAVGINERLRRAADRFIRKWEATQVELHGHYSVERFTAMNEYSRLTSTWRALAILPLTPLPSLILVALIDAISLEDPETGFEHSAATWVRATLVCFVYTHCAVEQIRLYSPNLKMEPLAGLYISLPVAIATNALTIGLSALIIWPLPFATILMSGPWLGFTTFFLLRVCGAHMRANPEAFKDVVRFATICGAQLTIVLIYAVFNIIFTNMSSTYQPMFSLFIPVFKILQKNVLSRILAGRDDTKPQVVILNVEIFNSLFISNCMQNSQSINTSITLISVNILRAAISLLDLHRMTSDVKQILDKIGVSTNALVSTAERILENYPTTANREQTEKTMDSNVLGAPTLARIYPKRKQVLPTMCMKVGEYEIPIPTALSRSHSVSYASRVTSTRPSTTKKVTELASAHPTTDLNRLMSQEYYKVLKKALQVLFLTEFMLLVEFTEVLVPIIYGKSRNISKTIDEAHSLTALLADLTNEELRRRVASVLEYGVMELVSLVALVIVLNRVVHRHSLQQLAFVLEREFLMVQPKLMLWVTLTMQSTLPQLGVDYTFKFAWIHHHSNNTTSS